MDSFIKSDTNKKREGFHENNISVYYIFILKEFCTTVGLEISIFSVLLNMLLPIIIHLVQCLKDRVSHILTTCVSVSHISATFLFYVLLGKIFRHFRWISKWESVKKNIPYRLFKQILLLDYFKKFPKLKIKNPFLLWENSIRHFQLSGNKWLFEKSQSGH